MSAFTLLPPAEPGYLARLPCLAWLHRAAVPNPALPVLICGPVGAEDLSAHRTLRLAAEALAAQGHTCLRFDPLGVGDSAAIGPDDDAVPGWIDSVHAAIDTLRAATGAPRVAILGLRLGATLAALAARARDDVAAFVAWVPVLQGRGLMREWKLLGGAGLPSLVHPDGSLETGGFRYAAATCASLEKLRLTGPLVRPAARMLVIDRDDLPVATAWCEALRADGVALETDALPGYEGLMAVPHLTVLPQRQLDRAVGWLSVLPAEAAGWIAPQPVLRSQLTLPGGGWEQPVRLSGVGPEPALLGVHVASADRGGSLAGLAVLVLNTGAERRIGPHGQFVQQARRWAVQGATVLRLDLAGLGDSPAAPGREAQRVYSDLAMHDLRRGIEWLKAQPGVQRVAVLGLCSGAYHAFEGAAQHLALDVAVVINPLLFFRPDRIDFDAVPVQDHAVQQLSTEAWRNLRDPARWRKLVSGEVDCAFIAATLVRRAGLAGRRLVRLLARGAGWPLPDDLAGKLRRAAIHHRANDARPRLHFVFAEGDPGWHLLTADSGRTLAALQRQGRVAVHRVPDADHTFSRAAARLTLQAVLDDVLAQAAPAHQTSGGVAGPDQALAWAASTRRARCASASST